MNKIFTLFAFACALLTVSNVSAQFNLSFNTPEEVASLPANCWELNGFAYSSNDLSTGTGSLALPLSDSVFFTTPLLSKPSGDVTITLTYRVNAMKPGINALKVNLVHNGTGKADNIKKIMVSSADGITTVTFTQPANKVPAAFTIQIGALNLDVEIDDLSINSSPVPGGCSPTPITLPVKLVNFQGSAQANKGQLKWAVAENETGDRFEVLRSADGRNFTTAGVVFINGKIGAESYAYTDGVELNAVTYYQLKIVNKNSSITYSNVITLKSAANKQGSAISILQNPVASTLTFSYTSASTTQSNIAIYNTNGVKVYGSRISSLKGTNAVSLPLDRHMAPGTYILEVSNDTERTVSKLIKQ
jgi:hypothetical protein